MNKLSTESWAQRRDGWIEIIQAVFGLEIYIPFASEIGLHVDGLDWSGVYLPGLDLLVEQSCPEQFTGRRRAFAIRDCAGTPELVVNQVSFDSLVSHELCHIFQDTCKAQIDHPPAPKVRRHYAVDVRRMLNHRVADFMTDVPDYYWHGDDFIRILLHASRRLAAAGVELDDSEMFANSRYGLSPLAWFRFALGSEPADRAELPMRLAVAGDPPEAFTQLWRDDLRRHTNEARQARDEIRAATRDEEQALHISDAGSSFDFASSFYDSSEEPSSPTM